MRDDRDAIVLTPEHVPVRLVPAGLGTRFLALFVDFVLVVAMSSLVGLALRGILPRGVGGLLATTIGFVLTWGYHVYFELRDGRTPGKRMTGLRVVDGRGLPLSPSQSFVRNVTRALDFLPFGYAVGASCALVDRHHRRLGDLAADTLVIEERETRERLPVLPRSPRFNSLDTPRVRRLARHRIGLADRELLLDLCLRADRLDPAARFDLMETAGRRYREILEIDDPHLSGESLVRDLTALLWGGAAGGDRPAAAPAGRPAQT